MLPWTYMSILKVLWHVATNADIREYGCSTEDYLQACLKTEPILASAAAEAAAVADAQAAALAKARDALKSTRCAARMGSAPCKPKGQGCLAQRLT